MARAVRKLNIKLFKKPKLKSNSIKDGYKYVMPKSQNIAVTGAGGFVGSYLCDYLINEGFNPVAISSHKRSLSKVISVFQLKSVKGYKDWEGVFNNKEFPKIDTIVHLMGSSRDLIKETSKKMLMKDNVEETKRLLEHVKKYKIRRFIYISTVRVSGEFSGKKPINETVKTNPKDDYAYSKYRAEIEIQKFCKTNDIEFVILRAPMLYGPKVFGNFLELMKLIYRGYPLPFGMLRNKKSTLYIGNLADAITKSINNPEAKNDKFVLSDGKAVKFSYWVKYLRRELKSPNIIFPVPIWALKLAGKIIRKEDKVNRLTSDLVVDSSKFRKKTGWEPPFTVFYGIADTVKWFKSSIVKK